MPKLLSLLHCFAMVFSLLALPAQAAKADASSVDGTYTGTGTGRNGDITLSVTIADGKITQIENVSNKEQPKYWAEAVKLFDSILAANGTDGVDAVSGATLSSDGILEVDVLFVFLVMLPGALKPGGRVAILTFHSGEDKLVKKAIKAGYREGVYSEYAKDVVRPSAEECAQNGRARSTKMRWAVKAE